MPVHMYNHQMCIHKESTFGHNVERRPEIIVTSVPCCVCNVIEICTIVLYLKASFGTFMSSVQFNVQSWTCPLWLLTLRKKCGLG